MKWPYINEYISDFKKAHIHSKQPLKGIDQAQLIEGLAGSIRRAMIDKFQTYEKAKKQASHIVGIQKLLHCVYKKINDTWTDVQGQPQKMLWPIIPWEPINHVCSQVDQRRQKKVQQACQRAAEREGKVEAHLLIGNPSMFAAPPIQKSATGEVQVNNPNTSTTDATTPPIDDLYTQLENLMLDEWEEMINCLCITWGEPYSQLVWSAWRRKSDAEGLYLSIWKSMQLHVFIHLTHKWDEAAALLDSSATENFIQKSYA